MKAKRRSDRNAGFPVSTALLLVLVLVLAAAFGGLAVYYSRGGSNDQLTMYLGSAATAVRTGTSFSEAVQAAIDATSEPTEPPTEPPKPVVEANGNRDSILCRDSYTALDAAAEAGRIAATADGKQLTNGQLQAYYLSAVEAGRNAQVRPEEGIPLDCQLCPLGDGNLSWQHYYLQQALNLWRIQLGLVKGTQEPQLITEEAFQPQEELHEKYVAPDLPVHGFLYQDLPNYTPNTMHQAYLDGMEERLNTLAAEKGFADLQDMLTQVYGGYTTAEDLIQSARDYNLAYMYFTEKSYSLDLSDVESTEPGDGEYNVSMRHLLMIPKEAEIAENGMVSAAETQWELCRRSAEQTLNAWQHEYLTRQNTPAAFARLANQKSQDEGSRLDGGLYYNVHKGQLIDVLDEWCFDPSRQAGDVAVLQSDLGIHIVYLKGFLNKASAENRTEEVLQQERQIVEKYADAITVKPDFSAISLWADTQRETVALTDTLYPDVAHQRFPEAITYFQQDYMKHRYGSSNVGTGGCGITTLGMLTTYMTDTIKTPAMLADVYGSYYSPGGTNGDIFRIVPAELGYYLDRNAYKIEDVIAAIQNGQVVISLQVLGHFTRGGHYLLVQDYYPETDTFQVRDSNIYNYERLSGHEVDYFTRKQLLSGGSMFWIMQKKITRIPSCARCGQEFAQRNPELLLNEDYLCEKCTAALSRRDNFMALSMR